MHSFKLVIFVIFVGFVSLSFAGNIKNDSVIKDTEKNITNNTDKIDISQTVESAKANQYHITESDKEALSAKKVENKYFESKNEARPSKPILFNDGGIWNELAQANQQAAEMTKPKKKYEGIETFILISLSMPKSSLERLFTEVYYQYDPSKILFVFQGWKAPDFAEFLTELRSNLPEGVDPQIVVDPSIYKKLEVKEVPFFAMMMENGEWKRVRGDVTYAMAIAEAKSQYNSFKPVGKLFPISEPNQLDYIYQKLATVDWQNQIEQATSKLKKGFESKVFLPVADSTYSYIVDGTVKFNKSAKFKDHVLVNKGDAINPLDYSPLSHQYVVLDITSDKQRKILDFWKTKFSNIKVISTVLPDMQQKYGLEKKYGIINQANNLLIKRFGLERVPSIVFQKSNKLKVEVMSVDADLSHLVVTD
jgi:hypothetical protein